MRIAIITPGFSANEQDWSIPVLLNLVRRLALSHDLQVFSLRYPPHREPYRISSARIHPFGGGPARGAGRLRLLLRALTSLIQFGRRRRFEVIHGFWADEPGFLAAVAGSLLRIPAVVSIMGGELVKIPDAGYGGQLSRANRWLIPMALRRASAVTVGSQYLKAMARPFISDSRLVRLPLGVDADLFHPRRGDSLPAGMEAHGIHLLQVATLTPVKDQGTLLRAMPAVAAKNPGVHLHLVGEGAARASLESLRAELSLQVSVTLHGNIPHHRLGDYYRAAHLGIQSSLHESQGLAVLEAAACGVVTVGTRVGILPELVPDGFLTPPEDTQALSRVICDRLDQPAATRQAAREVLEHVQAEFTLDHTLNSLNQLYTDLRKD